MREYGRVIHHKRYKKKGSESVKVDLGNALYSINYSKNINLYGITPDMESPQICRSPHY